MKQFFIGAAAAVLLTACNSGLGKKEAETTAAPINTPNVVSPLPQADSGTPAASPSGTAVALNPAHGQPGHRCDIPEGAPLNSAPIEGAMIPGNNNAAAVPTGPAQSIPLPNTSTAKLNPAHGQPGHRCDIAVGAPLN